jgi:hypothetical protein
MSQTIERVRNGVDTEQMYGTLDAIEAQPELGGFQFRATNRLVAGSHNRSTIRGFYGAGQEDTTRDREFVLDAGEPAILLGGDEGPNPAGYVLHALAACLTTSLVYVAARSQGPAHADDDFHRRLTAGCGNEHLLAALDPVRRALLRYERVYMREPARVARSAAQHDEIIATRERGDHAEAARLVRENLARGLPDLTEALEP